MPRILERCPDTRLVLVGSGPEETALRRLTDSLQLSSSVQFAGWLAHEETIREMATAEAVVVLNRSRHEGFGLVVAEAAACRSPLVVSRINVFEEILGADAGHALFVDQHRPRTIADTVFRSFTLPRRASARAAAALRHVQEQYTIERMVDNYVALYDSLAAKRPHSGNQRMPRPRGDNAREPVRC